jgi:hypothetical protein
MSSANAGNKNLETTDCDDEVAVSIRSLEAAVGYNCLVRELQNACIKRVAFYRSRQGGALSVQEAWARTYHSCLDEKEAQILLSEIKSLPTDKINFIDLAQLCSVDPRSAQTVWEMIQQECRDAFESGHLAAEAMTPAQYLRCAWKVASFRAVWQSFVDEWQPRGGTELALINMLAQAYLMNQFWLSQCVLRSMTEPRKSHQGYIQWQERMNFGAEISSGYTNGHWDIPYVSEHAATQFATEMVDKWNRIYIRILRNLRDLRRYSVTIHTAQQVNIS